MRTFDQLAPVGLARGDLEGDDVALEGGALVSLDGELLGGGFAGRTWASLRSLIGMPIVEVMVAMVVGVWLEVGEAKEEVWWFARGDAWGRWMDGL